MYLRLAILSRWYFIFLSLIGCGGYFKSEITSTEKNDQSSSASSPCPSNFVTTGPCLVEKAGVTVTDSYGFGVTLWSNPTATTVITAAIPNAFYANQQVRFTESNLVASNIRSGTSIFGVAGSLNPPYSVCSEDTGTLNASQCSTSANRYVASVAGASITSWGNVAGGTSVTAPIPDGYYKTKMITFIDTDLISANILNGVNIFGVIGSATAAFSPCTDNTLNAGACSTAVNRYVYTTANGGRSANCVAGFNGGACWTNGANQYVTGTLGGNITSWTNTSSATTVNGTISLGYYPGNTIAFTDANLIASNIKSGVSIFNVPGSYTGGGVTLMSNMHRDKTATQISQETEAITNSGFAFSNADPGYRAIPKISKDDDGKTGGSVTLVDRTGWDTNCDAATGAGGGSANSACQCGLSGTVEQRIADCVSHTVIGSNATWDGATKGNAGQGTWKLVTRTGSLVSTKGREVWRDERTKLLWSSLVSTSLNWCKATGSNFVTNNPSAENDPDNYCNSASYQTTGVWSAGTNKAISACFEDVDDNGASDYFTTTDADIDNAGKGNLNLGSTPRVDWRLPTIYDFEQANINGYRFVFPDTISNTYYEWSASVNSASRGAAWFLKGTHGDVSCNSRFIPGAVRCVGR